MEIDWAVLDGREGALDVVDVLAAVAMPVQEVGAGRSLEGIDQGIGRPCDQRVELGGRLEGQGRAASIPS